MEYTVTKQGGFEVRHYPLLDSTNEEAKRILQSGAQNNLVLIAAQQQSGRGRGGKEWVSDEGNLFMSIISTHSAISQPQHLPFIAALAVAQSLNTAPNLHIKWPNDVMIEGRKCCGILVERHKNGLVTGIGVNITSHPAYLDSGRKAGNLSEFGIDTSQLLSNILTNFQTLLKQYTASGFEPIRQQVVSCLYQIDSHAELDIGGKRVSGIIRGIAPSGNLVIETTNGMSEYAAGEVFA